MAESETERFAQHAGKAHYYDPARNPAGAYLAGVPSRDLSGEEWDALGIQQRREALHHGWWRLTPVPRPDAAPEEAAPRARRRAESVPLDSTPAGPDAPADEAGT